MSNKNKIKPISNVDTLQMEEMRRTVVEQELSARSWKAYYEKMYYSLESEKLEAEYKEYQERVRVRREEEEKASKEFFESLKSQLENVGTVEGEETPVISDLKAVE